MTVSDRTGLVIDGMGHRGRWALGKGPDFPVLVVVRHFETREEERAYVISKNERRRQLTAWARAHRAVEEFLPAERESARERMKAGGGDQTKPRAGQGDGAGRDSAISTRSPTSGKAVEIAARSAGASANYVRRLAAQKATDRTGYAVNVDRIRARKSPKFAPRPKRGPNVSGENSSGIDAGRVVIELKKLVARDSKILASAFKIDELGWTSMSRHWTQTAAELVGPLANLAGNLAKLPEVLYSVKKIKQEIEWVAAREQVKRVQRETDSIDYDS